MEHNIRELDKYLPYINETICIAYERKVEYYNTINKRKDDELDWSPESLAYSGKEKELFDYISKLDYEVIRVIQTIMYIGRDSSFAEDDGTYNYFKCRKYMDHKGWNKDKCIETMQIVQKVPLAEYLTDGCKKIGLK